MLFYCMSAYVRTSTNNNWRRGKFRATVSKMPAESDYCNIFSPEIESVEEFIQRFKLQNGEKLDCAGDNSSKRARILANTLPTVVLADIKTFKNKVTDGKYLRRTGKTFNLILVASCYVCTCTNEG